VMGKGDLPMHTSITRVAVVAAAALSVLGTTAASSGTALSFDCTTIAYSS